MSRIAQVVVTTIAALTAVVGPALAQAADQSHHDQSMDQTIKAMQDELQRLRQDNAQMKDQIDELRAKTDDNWMTEERATEIRGLVEDVLADADSRANLLNDGIMAGWSEHFFLADAFGRFLLQFEGMTQIRYVYNFKDEIDRNVDGFEITRTRLTFRGHVFNEDLQYLIRTEATPYPAAMGTAAGAFSLLDSWVRYKMTNEWSVRAGQFKLPFTREALISESEQLAVEQSLVNLNFGLDRSDGVELEYHDSANAWTLAMSNGLGSRQGTVLTAVFGGHANASAIAPNVEYALTTRYERLLAGTWNQFEDFTSPIGDEFGMLFGIGVHAQNNESIGTPFIGSNENRMIGVTADFSVEWGGASAFISATYDYLDTPPIPDLGITHMLGVVGQVGVYIAPKWEVFARGEFAQLETAGGGTFGLSDLGVGTIGYNYYIEGHDVKWTTDLGFSFTKVAPFWTQAIAGWRTASEQAAPEIVVRSQIQLVF